MTFKSEKRRKFENLKYLKCIEARQLSVFPENSHLINRVKYTRASSHFSLFIKFVEI